MKNYYYYKSTEKKDEDVSDPRYRLIKVFSDLFYMQIPSPLVIFISVTIFLWILRKLDLAKVKQITITNENVANIVLQWHAQTEALYFLIILLFCLALFKSHMIAFNKKPQGPVRGGRT